VEFLNGVGKGVETHAAKLEEAVGGDLQRLLETRTLRLKKLGVPVKHVRLPVPVFQIKHSLWFTSSCGICSFVQGISVVPSYVSFCFVGHLAVSM
jgi:hypothetical protein